MKFLIKRCWDSRVAFFVLNERIEKMRYVQRMTFAWVIALTATLFACASSNGTNRDRKVNEEIASEAVLPDGFAEKGDGGIDTATFAAGCFWCIEAQFLELAGVEEITPGYSGGHTKNPTYKEVLTGKTGHAESVNVLYDSDSISFGELLEAFFVAHDPTQLNRQGNDVGTQYRSAIFYHNLHQKELIEYYMNELKEQQVYSKPIVTEVSAFTVFYEAEDYHKNYYALNPGNPYCQRVIQPKLEKFKEIFAHKLKK